MTVFSGYAEYYDLMYADKDYPGETTFVLDKLGANKDGAYSLLELGCGTGRHAVEFLKNKITVTGIDLSTEMIDLAKERIKGHQVGSSDLEFFVGDVRTLRLNRKFDFVVSLFHVISYQVNHDDLTSAFLSAARHLAPGGKFLFDFWYGPAVISDPPQVRVRRLQGHDFSVLRIAEPQLQSDQNRVKVSYELVFQLNSGGPVSRVHETHTMRYLFLPEISEYLDSAGLRLCECGSWMNSQPLGLDSWYGWATAEHKSGAY